jgi:glycine/D-amino acid oxidase-like deaminating enzyme
MIMWPLPLRYNGFRGFLPDELSNIQTRREQNVPILPNNDVSCGWIEILPKRKANPALNGIKRAKWLIIGAGYSGLSASITLAENLPDDEIVLVEANKAGEGASARNSGYLVDSTLNDGHLSDSGLVAYESKYALNEKAIAVVRRLVKENNIECDWNECGKYHATSDAKDEKKLNNYNELLNSLGIKNSILGGDDLARHLGTNFYRMAVKTQGGVMLQPAALALGMVRALPENVLLYENTPVTNISTSKPHKITCQNGEIIADNIIVAVNGFMPSLGIKKSRVFPLLLTASLTRPLNKEEQTQMRDVGEWGVLPANSMGATVRYTADKRLMIRNTAEVSTSLEMNPAQLAVRQKDHLSGLLKRFPFLPKNIFEHCWSGITCISANNANVFEQANDNHWVIGCYNGGGIGLATLFGQQIAYLALDKAQSTSKQIVQRPQTAWLPPQPFLNMGVRLKLAKERLGAKKEQ